MSDSTTTGQVRRKRTPTTDHDVLDAVYRLTPAGTAEVAELIGFSRQSADYRLRKLEEQGRIWSKKVGPTKVWIHPRVMSKDFAP